MERTTPHSIEEKGKRGVFLRAIIIGVFLLVFCVLLIILVAVDGFYKVENLGNGYYVVGEIGDYDIEYQYHYLGTLHNLPVFDVDAIYVNEEWILAKTHSNSFWAIDKKKRPAVFSRILNSTRSDVLDETSGILIGPMDSICYHRFIQEHHINKSLKKIVYRHLNITSRYKLVQYSRSIWYIAYKDRDYTKLKSGRFSIIHLSPVCKLGYETETNTIFCKTADNNFWIINANRRFTKDECAVDSLCFYSRLMNCGYVTLLSIPDNAEMVPKMNRSK